MSEINYQTKQMAELLPQIARNLRFAPLMNKIKPGLTTSQLMILLILRDTNGIALPIGKLAQELAISFPAVSGIVDRLYKQRLIKRVHSRQDRRVVLVKLSNAGKKTIDKLPKVFEELLSNTFAKIPFAEQKTISKAVKKVFEFSTVLSQNNHKENISLS